MKNGEWIHEDVVHRDLEMIAIEKESKKIEKLNKLNSENDNGDRKYSFDQLSQVSSDEDE